MVQRIITAHHPRSIKDQYEIWYREDPENYLRDIIRQYNPSSLWVLTDDKVAELVYAKIKELLPVHKLIILPEGESSKSLQSVEYIASALAAGSADRNAVILMLGGGMICDIGAYTASCWKRGIRYVLIPTSLLAQLDASVGGKTAINLSNQKNMLGLFSLPDLVVIDPLYLSTLDEREFKSGFAEALKHGLIADDTYWEIISTTPWKEMEWEYIIYRSLLIKTEIVNKDMEERWIRKTLNFGHTIGHAMESLSMERGFDIRHGEAIAFGMIVESALSVEACGLPIEDFKTIARRISDYKFPILPPEEESKDREKFFAFIKNDKKNEGNAIKFSLLSKIGKCVYDIEIGWDRIWPITRSIWIQAWEESKS